MLLTGFPAGPWGTNCWILAAEERSECVIVDPGMEAFERVQETVERHDLKPVAVLLTHGHIDHTFSVVPVCSTYEMPAWIHPDDRDRLADPLGTMSEPARVFIEQMTRGQMVAVEPSEVRTASDGQRLELAGLAMTVRHAPGHTPGSILFHLPDVGEGAALLSGDVLFRDGIGRTDLPGGDPAAMRRSLRDVVLSFDDETRVYPGHGETTTIGRERRESPFLRNALGGGA